MASAFFKSYFVGALRVNVFFYNYISIIAIKNYFCGLQTKLK